MFNLLINRILYAHLSDKLNAVSITTQVHEKAPPKPTIWALFRFIIFTQKIEIYLLNSRLAILEVLRTIYVWPLWAA